jgi:hypothetical protein
MEEKQKNHSFGKGLVCGILLMVVVLGVGGCAAPYAYWILRAGLLKNSDSVLTSEAKTKIEELDRYIDN